MTDLEIYGDEEYIEGDEDGAMMEAIEAYYEGVITGHDDLTGEDVEYETFDEEMFDLMLEEENYLAEHKHVEETKEESHEDHAGYKNHIHSSEEDATLPATLDEVESPLLGAALGGQIKDHDHTGHSHSHGEGIVHDEEHCDECQLSAQEDMDMTLAMAGFSAFAMILFMMWYMLRSCKNKPE